MEEKVAPSRDLSKTEMEIIEERMHERSNRLQQKCSEFGLDVLRNDSLHRPNSWEFLVNKKHHIIWYVYINRFFFK